MAVQLFPFFKCQSSLLKVETEFCLVGWRNEWFSSWFNICRSLQQSYSEQEENSITVVFFLICRSLQQSYSEQEENSIITTF